MVRIIFALLAALITASSALADTVKLADNAPDSYTVVKGDTLWDISGRFLKQPWRWPEVWRLNRAQIKNPHWIYPGQVIYLDRSGPYLTTTKPGSAGTEKLSPKVYESDVPPISSVPMSQIEAFLTRPLIVSDKDAESHATIVAADEGHINNGTGDVIFAKNVGAEINDWAIYRRAKPLVDPVTQEQLGFEASYLGSATQTAPGTPATLRITSAKNEIGVGDRMLPAERPELLSIVPHAPTGEVDGRVVKIHNGLYASGKYDVIVASVGRRNNIEPGHVLGLYRARPDATYDLDGKKEQYKLPDERLGLAFVFRVFDKVAYALVVESSGPVRVADSVRKP